MLILGIESYCDETAASVVRDGREILSSVVASQADIHALYGGVVPEIASRMHIENIVPVVSQAVLRAGIDRRDVGAVAVTAAPGLIGALLTGLSFAKAAAYALGRPLVPVHHIKGHVAANYLAFPALEPPFFALVISGGHNLLRRHPRYGRHGYPRLHPRRRRRTRPSTGGAAVGLLSRRKALDELRKAATSAGNPTASPGRNFPTRPSSAPFPG